MNSCLLTSFSKKAILVAMLSGLMTACATEPTVEVEPSFHDKVADCSKVADRSERDRCLYGG